MEIKEFEQRTGYYPTLEEYTTIEKFYMKFNGDKDEFCKAYKNNTDYLAEKIQREADMNHIEASRQQTAEIERLKAELEREQEWRSYIDADNVSQSDYKELAIAGGTRKLSDDEAKELLYDWYGFAKEKITIHRSTPVYEVNRHRRLRETGKNDRTPLYNATDWHYIRFDCGCMSYELLNDNLRSYMQ